MRTSTILALLLGGAAAVVARAMLLVVTVRGTSMSPGLRPGDQVLVLRTVRRALSKGSVVVARMPEIFTSDDIGPEHLWHEVAPNRTGDALIVKKVAALPGETGPDGRTVPPDHVFLLGTSDRSFDSRRFGPVATDLVVGVVLRKLR